jgi:hypothetical protein
MPFTLNSGGHVLKMLEVMSYGKYPSFAAGVSM